MQTGRNGASDLLRPCVWSVSEWPETASSGLWRGTWAEDACRNDTRMHTNCAFGGSMSKPNVMLATVTMQWCERCVVFLSKPARLFGSDGHGLFCPSGEWPTQGYRWLRLPHFGPTLQRSGNDRQRLHFYVERGGGANGSQACSTAEAGS